MLAGMNPTVLRKWRWLFIYEVTWSRWGLGVEFSLGYWWPREWSAYLHFGPLLIGGGLEDRQPEFDPGEWATVEIPVEKPQCE